MFEDSIYIYNPGKLPEGWTLETLFQKHESQAPNQLLAKAFHRCGDIESWGRGIEKIVNYCREAQIPPPVYSCVGSVCAIFTATEKLARLREVTGETSEKTSEKTSGKTSEKTSGKTSEKTSEKTSGKTSEKTSGKTSELQAGSQERIIALMKANPAITTALLAAKLRISTRAVEYQLRKLKSSGRLVRLGAAKGGHWEIVEKQ